MNLSKIDLNLFVIFDAIYAQQSLTRAAEVLHVTQPAVSNSLARLRGLLEDPLFVRSPRGVTPTPLARQLIEPVRAALKNLDDCVQARLDFVPASARQTFRVNATAHAEFILLPQLVRHVAATAPGVKLEICFLDRRDVPLELANGNLQLSIDAPLLNHPELMSQPLGRDHYVCVMHPDHPLARGRLTETQYLKARHVHVSSRIKGTGHIDLALRSIGKKRQVGLRLQHYYSLPAIIAGTDYLAAVPQSLACQWGLTIKKLPFDTPPLELQLYWHRSVDHDPAVLWLRQAVLSTTFTQ
ncbi:LysR family transcriptional regulator [Kineobactrum salinum]|uniref:LysR family transcriptional regulator n=1 Tax=Kineobactrum salinum TaxID=2708301 RepID=A0A6C0TZX1_9GAMM|nr:LysR family transcriptional regulator [Kineobactrum salinum]QIB65392.1 LysR family transcriptional regulator [Kineobactrum salinum]